MSEADEFTIAKLQTGFLVRAPGHPDRPCAALTRFDDLVSWLRIRFGVEDEARHHKAVLDNLIVGGRRHERMTKVPVPPTVVGVDLGKPEPDDAGDDDDAAETAQHAGDAMAYTVSALSPPEASIDELRAELEGKMGAARAAETAPEPDDPGSSPGQAKRDDVPEAKTAPAADRPKGEKAPPADDRDRLIASLPAGQQQLLDHIELAIAKHGEPVHFGWKSLADKLHMSIFKVRSAAQSLRAKGLIRFQLVGGDPRFSSGGADGEA